MTGFDARAHIDGILLKLAGDSDEDGAVFPSMAQAVEAKRQAEAVVMYFSGQVMRARQTSPHQPKQGA